VQNSVQVQGVEALIAHGGMNREIASRLKVPEQVIKNYLRSIYDKTGVSDRPELALFTLHHRVLAQMKMSDNVTLLPPEQWADVRVPFPSRGIFVGQAFS
jgi:hypothetical protein